jgi:hypothetical protein
MAILPCLFFLNLPEASRFLDDKVEARGLPADFVSGIEGMIAPTSLFLSNKIQGLHDVRIIRIELERFL